MLKQTDMGSSVLPKAQVMPKMAGPHLCRLRDPGANNHMYIVQLTFPLIMGP